MMKVKCYEKETEGKGVGVFAKELIPKGTLVWKLTDPIRVSRDEFEKLPEEIKKQAYQEGDHFVYATGYGESWNHSCEANTWWTADDELTALRDIKADEEITYDYATTDADPSMIHSWECKCGAKKCRKIIKWNDILIPELYEKYKGHLPKWVEDFVQKNKKGISLQ